MLQYVAVYCIVLVCCSVLQYAPLSTRLEHLLDADISIDLRHIRFYTCVAACCSMLQCGAMCCSVVQCVAVCCSVLQYAAKSRSVSRLVNCVAVCCSVLQHVAVCRSASHCVAVC